MDSTIYASALARVPVDADVVWRKMKKFDELDWAVGIDEVELVSQSLTLVRRVRLVGREDWIDERLIAFDDEARWFRYCIDGDGMPGLRNYKAEARVLSRADGALIRWRCQADADADSRAETQAMLDPMAENIVRLFAAQFDAEGGGAGDVSG